ILGASILSGRSALAMPCETCDEMFQECMGEVEPDFPAGYAVCQVLWDNCKASCTHAMLDANGLPKNNAKQPRALTAGEVKSMVLEKYLAGHANKKAGAK